jgi:hypothetical protein
MITVDGVAEPRVLQIPIGTGRSLWIWTGTAELLFQGTGTDWVRDQAMDDLLGLGFDPFDLDDFGIAASASLASIQNEGAAVNAGWAVDQIVADRIRRPEDNLGAIRWTANLAVRDVDGYLMRLSFQVFFTGVLS